MKFVISNHHSRGDFCESRTCTVPRTQQDLCRDLSHWGLTQISWGSIGLCGVLFVSQNNLLFRTLEAIVPATHLLKITSPMLIAYYSISVILSSLRKRKAYTWEVAEARMRLQKKVMNNRISIATDRLACSRSASSRYGTFLS